MIRHNLRFTLALAAVALFVPRVGNTAGFGINETGARPLGMGNAFVAIADNPSAIFFNPAGIAQLKGLQLEAGLSLVVPQFGYTLPAPGTSTQVDAPATTLVFPVPNVYASYRIHDRVAAGLGLFAPFGLGIKWPETVSVNGATTAWWARNIISEISLQTAVINPTVAFKLHERVLLGGGLMIMPAAVHLKRAVTFSDKLEDDVNVELSGKALGLGATGGLLVKAVPDYLHIGVAYRGGAALTFSGNAVFTKGGSASNIPPAVRARLVDGPVEAKLNLPHTLSFGLSSQPIKALTLGAGVDVTLWSSYDKLAIDFVNNPELSSSEPKHWKNTITFRAGAEYRIFPQWPVRLGFVYDQSPAPNTTVGPELPDASRVEFAFGTGYTFFGKLRADLAYLFLLTGDKQTADSAPLVGTYRAQAHVLAFSLAYGFNI